MLPVLTPFDALTVEFGQTCAQTCTQVCGATDDGHDSTAHLGGHALEMD
jgi:hypothetical protein